MFTACRTRVFISYRREDTEAAANVVLHELEKRTSARVFLDTAAVRKGSDWEQTIERECDAANAMIAVIGPVWLTLSRDGKRRLDHKDDWVRRELASALRRGIPVYPVHLDDAANLDYSTAELPKEIARLSKIQRTSARSSLGELRNDLAPVLDSIRHLARRRQLRCIIPLSVVVVSIIVAVVFLMSNGTPSGVSEKVGVGPVCDLNSETMPHSELGLKREIESRVGRGRFSCIDQLYANLQASHGSGVGYGAYPFVVHAYDMLGRPADAAGALAALQGVLDETDLKGRGYLARGRPPRAKLRSDLLGLAKRTKTQSLKTAMRNLAKRL